MLGKQLFDYEQVESKMSSLNTVFTKFDTKLNQIDKILNENVGSGPDSALNGVQATSLLASWNSYSSSFDDFKKEFDSLYGKVQLVSKGYSSFENNALGLFQKNNPFSSTTNYYK